jgi:7-cyano-7-deazaguanine synthase
MKTVILLSGGIDSAVILADRVATGDDCLTVTFDYGQTHRDQEILAADTIALHYGAENIVLPLYDFFGMSALLGDSEIPESHADNPDDTTVPGRNLVMLSIAAAIADARGAAAVFHGAHADDYAGYVDCRPEFMNAMAEAVSRGTTRGVSVHAPFLSWSKSEIVALGRALNVPFSMTWSCYRGAAEPCKHCGACQSRQEALT